MEGVADVVGPGPSGVPSLFAARRGGGTREAETESAESQPASGRIDVEQSNGVWFLTLHGDHDVSTRPILHRELELVRRAGGPVVVDLSRATLIDSTVIGAIGLAGAGEGRAAAPLALVAPANYVGTKMIELVGIGSRTPVYPTRARAMAAHRREAGPELTRGSR
jgi:anti-sigma B factor antagonist